MDALLSLEQLVNLIAQFVAKLAELSAAIIIALAVLEGLWRVLGVFWKRDDVPDDQKTCGWPRGVGLPLHWNSCWPLTSC